MTGQEKDRLVVEALGVDYIKHFGKSIGTRQNGKPVFIPNLATPEGFFWIWPRMQTMLWGEEFLEWWWMGSESVPKAFYLIAFNLNPPRLRDSLAEFLEGRK